MIILMDYFYWIMINLCMLVENSLGIQKGTASTASSWTNKVKDQEQCASLGGGEQLGISDT